jgi:hypothetical protein
MSSNNPFPELNQVVYIGDGVYVGCSRFRELEIMTSNGLVISKPIVFDKFAAQSLVRYINDHIISQDIA